MNIDLRIKLGKPIQTKPKKNGYFEDNELGKERFSTEKTLNSI